MFYVKLFEYWYKCWLNIYLNIYKIFEVLSFVYIVKFFIYYYDYEDIYGNV